MGEPTAGELTTGESTAGELDVGTTSVSDPEGIEMVDVTKDVLAMVGTDISWVTRDVAVTEVAENAELNVVSDPVGCERTPVAEPETESMSVAEATMSLVVPAGPPGEVVPGERDAVSCRLSQSVSAGRESWSALSQLCTTLTAHL